MRLSLRALGACLALLMTASVASAAKPESTRTSPGQEAKQDGSTTLPPGQVKQNGRDTAPGQVKEPGTPADPHAQLIPLVTEPGPAEDPSLTQLGETVGMAPAGGDVKVRLPGSHEWTTLSDDAPLPLGSAVDAREGLVEIASEATNGVEQNAVVTGAIVRVEQDVLAQGATELVIGGGDFSRCRDDAQAAAVKARASVKRKRTKSGVVRGLWAAGKGRFRTRGRYGTASVRGTRWATVDRCSSTTVKVFDGIVDVTDLITGRTVAVEAGEKRVIRAAAR
jgi:hypothetical protein